MLVGGRSLRMGPSKATLPWHGSTLVRRVAGIVSRGVGGPVILVRSPGQTLPKLPSSFEVLDDIEIGRGPLGGLAVGLQALASRCEIAYVSSTDVPFLHPAFVRRVLSELGAGNDSCVPYVRGFRQPLSAAYRTGLAPLVADMLSNNRLAVSLLLGECRAKELNEETLLKDRVLASLDPGLESVTNLNDPPDYDTAIARPEPLVEVHWADGESSAASTNSTITLRAATLDGAVRAAGASLGPDVVVSLNGYQLYPDPEEPLVEGDVVSFGWATAP